MIAAFAWKSISCWSGCGVPQTCVGRDAELLRLASNAGLLRPASEVSMLLKMRGLHFSSKYDLRVEVRLASDDLSLVIFGQSIDPLQSFRYSVVDWDGFRNTLDFG